MGILGLLTWPFVPESPRWLAQNGKKEEALKLLLKIADTNGKNLSPENITLVDNFLQKIDDGATKEDRKRATSMLELFQPKFRLTFAILTCSWIMANVGSYTLSLSAATLLFASSRICWASRASACTAASFSILSKYSAFRFSAAV